MRLPINTSVRNMKGTADRYKKRDHRGWKLSWKKYYTLESGQWPDNCEMRGCGNQAEVGTHVELDDQNGVFIFPKCTECNQNGTAWEEIKWNSYAVKE